MPPKTRTKSGGIEPDVLFPSVLKFVPSSQLSTEKGVIGVHRPGNRGGGGAAGALPKNSGRNQESFSFG